MAVAGADRGWFGRLAGTKTAQRTSKTFPPNSPHGGFVSDEGGTTSASEVEATMARNDALLRLHKKLVARRDELLSFVRGNLADMGPSGDTGDEADVAIDSMKTEMSSQLAELEGKELQQIHRALSRLKNGQYGSCEVCNDKIPVARLNALPYTTLCIKCQRELEENPERAEELESNWQKVYDAENKDRDSTPEVEENLEVQLG
jgi:DnaK suppressor protein